MSNYEKFIVALLFGSLLTFSYGVFLEIANPENSALSYKSGSGIQIDRTKLRTQLKNQEYDLLNQSIQSYIDQMESGELAAKDIDNLFLSFSVVDPSLEKNISLWLKTNSWSSKYAASNYYKALAWGWRGNANYSRVPEYNIKKFRHYLNTSLRVLPQENTSELLNSLVASEKIVLVNGGADFEISEEEFIKESVKRFPTSVPLLRNAIWATSNKWGGNKSLRQELVFQLDKLYGRTEEVIEYYRGVDARDEDNDGASIRHLKKAIAINPNETLYHYTLARSYHSNTQYNESITTLKTVLKAWPTSSNARRISAYNYFQIEEYDKAAKEIEIALEISPYDRKINSLAARIYGKLGNKDRLKEANNRALYFAQYDRYQMTKVADSMFYDQNNFAEAKKLYKASAKIEPYDVGANYGLSIVNARQESCEMVASIHTYMTGCQMGIGNTKRKCAASHINWAHSVVNYLNSKQKCPEINNYDFSVFR